MSKSRKSVERVLGVAATGRAVHAVLLESGPDGPEVLRTFTRQRALSPTGFEGAPGAVTHKPEPVSTGSDITIDFGDGASSGGGGSLFMAAEFGSVEEQLEDDGAQVETFELELGDIFAELNDSGFGDASVAFALEAADSQFVEVRLAGTKRSADRNTLIEALSVHYEGPFDKERVAFLPMTPTEEGEQRYLAVFTRTVDPVTATIKELNETMERLPAIRLIDAEVPALLGLARVARRSFEANDQPTGAVNTLVVRAGVEDTVVLFMRGDVVHHCESLKSLTAFDAADTICSRVLLQQDEHGVSDVHRVLLLTEEREKELTNSFAMFFPDATVEPLRSYLPHVGEEDAEGGSTAVVAAMVAALRLADDPYYAQAFEEVNFLPKKLVRRKVKLPITWHVAAMSIAIVVTTLFFMTRYSSAETEIESYRVELENIAAEEVSTDIHRLQARIDSMQQLYSTYTRALEVLDTLLLGSDRWSRILETSSREAMVARGLWVELFQPNGPNIRLTGTATSRDQVVRYASRLNGTIEYLAFSEIRDFPVYDFKMIVPFEDDLPEAAKYLREQVQLERDEEEHAERVDER